MRILTHRRRVPTVALVAVRGLHEDGGLGEALRKDLAADVVEPDPLADVPPGLLDDGVAVHVGEQAQAKSAG